MIISKNIIVKQAQNTNQQNSVLNQSEENGKQQKKNSMYAGNLNMMQQQDTIAMKHVEAQKKAMKNILDQFGSDGAIDDDIATRRQHQSALSDEAKAAQGEIDRLEGLRQQLKVSYGVDDNNEEQKNLDLIEKSMDVNQTLSDDEMEQLKNMGPLTGYQKTALEYDSMQEVWKQRVDEANQGKANEGQTIVGIKLALLKTHPMTDAQKQAAVIMEAANKAAIDMILQQAKDKVDEDMEKTKEEAEKAKEDKEAEEAKKQDDSVSQSNVTGQNSEIDNAEQLQQAAFNEDKMLYDIKKLIEKQNILEDDTKGIVLDELV